MGRRRITAHDHAAFVALSGDHNPIHTDPLVARRTPFGQPVVHGMHLVALALDEAMAITGLAPETISATFRLPVAIGTEVDVSVDIASDRTSARVDISADRVSVATVTAHLTDRWTSGNTALLPDERVPVALGATDLDGHSGSIPVAADTSALTTRFPNLVAAVGPDVVAEIVSWSRLIGMYAPGERSLFASFAAKRITGAAPRQEITFRVSRFDDRFNLATIEASGPAFNTTLRAMLRPRPVVPEVGNVTVHDAEFAGQRWLVVGGSRGLGAVAVQLLARGEADVRLTYRVGQADADLLAADTGAAAHHLDTGSLDEGLGSVTADGWSPTHLAYLASPPIFVGINDRYSPDLEQNFRAVYVDAFEQLVVALQPELLSAWWPSSSALDEHPPGMAEYCTAKAAGEQLCLDLTSRFAPLHIHAPRLPRLLTDQTTSYVPVEFGDTTDEVLRALRSTASAAGPAVH